MCHHQQKLLLGINTNSASIVITVSDCSHICAFVHSTTKLNIKTEIKECITLWNNFHKRFVKLEISTSSILNAIFNLLSNHNFTAPSCGVGYTLIRSAPKEFALPYAVSGETLEKWYGRTLGKMRSWGCIISCYSKARETHNSVLVSSWYCCLIAGVVIHCCSRIRRNQRPTGKVKLLTIVKHFWILCRSPKKYNN